MELANMTLEIFSKLEHKWLCHGDSKKTRILSIDGGSTDATAAGAVLIHLEQQIRAKTGDPNSHIADFFDIIAGTGIGGIFAAMLAADDGNGRPLYTAEDAVHFVTGRQSELFSPTNVGVFRRRRRFSGRSMDKVLKEAFRREDGKQLTLKDTCKPLLIPCFDLNTAAPFVFSRADALESASYDFEMWKVCRTTSGTPSMFKPFPLTSVDGKASCVAVDGGIVMNNPTSMAVTHVLHNKRDFPLVTGVEDLLVLSLGNGPIISPPILPNPRHPGHCSTSAIVEIASEGVSDTVDQLIGNAFCFNRSDYLRVQAYGNSAAAGRRRMDGVLKEKGVETLPFGGKRLLTETNGERIEGLVQRLMAVGKGSLPASPSKETAIGQLLNGR